MEGRNVMKNKGKRMGANIAVALFVAAALSACGSAGTEDVARGPASITDSALVMEFSAAIVDASGAVVQTSPVDMFSGAFQFTNIPQGDYKVPVYDPYNNMVFNHSLTLTGDALSISGNAFMDPFTWIIEYAPPPATDPAATDPAATDPTATDPTATDPAKNPAERAKAEAISAVTGIPVDVLLDMRRSGMGWGEICNELGIDPSVLGVGPGNGKGKK